MKKLWNEFKEFINRGNAMDLAVAVVVGAAFSAIINSVVTDLVTPLISLMTAGIDFSSLEFVVGEGADAASFRYGALIQATITFFITAFVIFLIIKAINKLANKQLLNKAAPTIPCPYCKTLIPDDAVRCPHCTTLLDSSKVPEDVR